MVGKMQQYPTAVDVSEYFKGKLNYTQSK